MMLILCTLKILTSYFRNQLSLSSEVHVFVPKKSLLNI